MSKVFIGSFRVVEQESDEVVLLEELVDFDTTSSDNFLERVEQEVLVVLLLVEEVDDLGKEVLNVTLWICKKRLYNGRFTREIPPRATEA